MEDETADVFIEENEVGIGKLLELPVIIIELEGERIVGIGRLLEAAPLSLRRLKGELRLVLLLFPKRSIDDDRSVCITGIGRDEEAIDEDDEEEEERSSCRIRESRSASMTACLFLAVIDDADACSINDLTCWTCSTTFKAILEAVSLIDSFSRVC